MKSLFKKLFLEHRNRKLLAIILAIAVWFLVNNTLITSKTVINVPVKIENIPPGKTVEGIQSNGFLTKRVNLTIEGNKKLLSELNSNDLQVVFDATGREGEWIASINKKNLRSDNPDVNVSQGIRKVSQQNFIIKLTNLMSEKIPIIITKPIGEAPRGYQFIDVWPYELSVTVSGPANVVKNLKHRGLKLTFNLNDITKGQLDQLTSKDTDEHKDVVSFFVPNHWKQISLPLLSSTPIEINDTNAKYLRIDFLRYGVLEYHTPVPISLYYPPSQEGTINPSKVNLTTSELIQNRGGIKMITPPLYVKGVSALFLDVVKEMVELTVIVNKNKKGCLDYSIQFINAKALEDRYVRLLTSDASDEELRNLQPQVRDDYLRNRFRSYMNRFQFYRTEHDLLDLCPKLQGNAVSITEQKADE
ncbi:CdaR family protein [Candidatus Neptunochlamydia vexilliferae]|uniref:CdaR family protein n=1 Tax=Candidatus Neptunichlamydia vexilliferae TaxID=1651774 RepID=UPI0018913FCC|nr:CdaR family protein [Candidatus Neptunochlamydia vexilliferae]